jgi:hypothetical protein
MITDRQVRRLRKLLIRGETLTRAAWKTGMDRKSARIYRDGTWPQERVQRAVNLTTGAAIGIWAKPASVNLTEASQRPPAEPEQVA